MFKQLKMVVTLGATLAVALSANSLYAQEPTGESCSSSDIQDAIDGAASDLGCNAVGAFISPQSIGGALVDKCSDKPKEACRKCMALNIEGIKRGYSTFVRLGVLEQSSIPELRTTLSYLLKNGCSNGGNSGNPEDQPEDGDRPGDGSGSTPPPPAPTPGSALSGAQVASAILAACPCPTNADQLTRFSGCVGSQVNLLSNRSTETAIKEALASIRVTCNLPSGDK